MVNKLVPMKQYNTKFDSHCVFNNCGLETEKKKLLLFEFLLT